MDSDVFSWKKSKKEAQKHMKQRIAIYEKNGRNDVAKRLKEKLTRVIEDENK